VLRASPWSLRSFTPTLELWGTFEPRRAERARDVDITTTRFWHTVGEPWVLSCPRLRCRHRAPPSKAQLAQGRGEEIDTQKKLADPYLYMDKEGHWACRSGYQLVDFWINDREHPYCLPPHESVLALPSSDWPAPSVLPVGGKGGHG